MQPAIYESSGGYGRHALNLLADIQRLAGEQASMMAPFDLVHRFQDAVAIGIQRGNALAVRRCVEMTEKESWRRRVVSVQQQARSQSVAAASLGSAIRSGFARLG